jgi:serine/threonine-protein kinase/endoribonuclease IRE1
VKAAARKFLPQQSQPISHVQQQVQVEPEVQVALTLNSTEVVEPVAERKVRFAPEIIDEGAETEKEAEESTWKTAEGGDQDQDPDDETLQPTEGQKKKHKRGKRGGRKNKKKGDADEVDKIVDSITTPMQNMQPDAESTNGRVTDVDDSLILRNITVDTSQVLGNGSGGTTVYAGTYEGREVAVKRMLLQYHNLALTEIALLQQSDDHPNVVRYFCNEKDKDFLYDTYLLIPDTLLTSA